MKFKHSLQFSTGDKNLVTQMLTCLNDMHKIIQAKVILLLKYSNFLKKYLRRYTINLDSQVATFNNF